MDKSDMDGQKMLELRDTDYKRMIGKGEIIPFEEKVLCSGLCDFTLPANFIRRGSAQWVMYDCSGYTSLSELEFRSFDDLLEVLAKTIANLRKASEFLIDPGKITLSEGTVFQNLKKRDVKFAYFPAEESSVAKNIAALMDHLAGKAPAGKADAVRLMEREMRVRNMSLREMQGYIALVRRDIKCGTGRGAVC